MKQKFKRGDLVHITKNMPPEMSYFECDMDAIIVGSYADLYGGDDCNIYSVILIKDGKYYDTVSWYDEKQLTFIKHASNSYIGHIWKSKKSRAKNHVNLT